MLAQGRCDLMKPSDAHNARTGSLPLPVPYRCGDDSIIIAPEIRRKTFAPACWISFNLPALLRRFGALS
jgi:hypothetical protein